MAGIAPPCVGLEIAVSSPGRPASAAVPSPHANAQPTHTRFLCCSGSWRDVHALLSALLDPAEAEVLAEDWEACFGSSSSSSVGGSGRDSGSGSSSGGGSGWEQEVMLHRPGQFPCGAICPAQLLLCPAPSRDSSSGSMQACLWVHPAAAAEAYAALQVAAQQAGSQASLAVLNVRRLELRGGAADTALAVALAGATASGIAAPTNGAHARRRSSRHQQHRQQAGQQATGQAAAQQAQQAHQQDALPPPPLPLPLVGLQHGDAVQLMLPDPRLCKPVALGSAAAGLLQPTAADEPQQLDMQMLLQAPLLLSESELSQRRQQLRQRLLQLEQPNGSGGLAGRSAAAGEQQQQQRQQREQEDTERRGYCPAVLVRHDGLQAGVVPGKGATLLTAALNDQQLTPCMCHYSQSCILILPMCPRGDPAPFRLLCRLVAHCACRLGAALLAGGCLCRLQASRPAGVALAAHAAGPAVLPLGSSRHRWACCADGAAAAAAPVGSGQAAQSQADASGSC